MSRRKRPGHLFPNAADDRLHAYADTEQEVSEQENSSAYRLAYDDIDFLMRDEMRPVRFLLELSKPELMLQEHGINHAVVIFGSARTTSMEQAVEQQKEIEQALASKPDDAELLSRQVNAQAALRHAGYYEQGRTVGRLLETKISSGLGLRLESSIGIVGIDYAVGEEDSILNGKVHFGLRNEF